MDPPPAYESCVPAEPPTYEESITDEYYRSRSCTGESSLPFYDGKSLRRRRRNDRNFLGTRPTPMICPYCASSIVTEVVKGPTMDMKFFQFLLTIFCCCLCYGCRQRTHYCPKCYNSVGTSNIFYDRLT